MIDRMPMDILADPMGYLAPRRGSGPLPLILEFGDSQIPGNAPTDSADPAFNVTATQSITFVKRYLKHYALAASDPITFETDVSGGVRPDHIGGTRGMSMEISMGQVFTAAGLNCVMGSWGVFGMSCAQSIPASTYPTQPPAGPNALAQFIAFGHALEVAQGALTKVILLSEGNNDGANSTDANNLAANSATLATALLAAFPGARIIWIKINADTVNATGVPNEATAISQQAAFFAANPSIVPIYNDDCALFSDHAHFTGDTALTVGQRVAFAALDLLGVARVHPATFPAVLGFGPQLFSAGLSMSPHSWGGAQAGHLEILVRASLTGSGVNNAFADPAGWTLVATTTSASGGATIRVAFYRRAVDASMLTANHGNTAPTTVPAVNSNEFSDIITIGGPNANPTIEASQLSKNDAFGTGLTMAGVTTLGANRTVVMITVGFRTNATPNPVTITGTNLAGVALIRNGTRDSGLSNFCTIDVQTGHLAAAGPSGTGTTTLALASIAIGGMFSIAP